MNKYAVGENIFKMLKHRKMTQHDLAVAIGSHDATVSKWMSGQRSPSAYAVLRMSKVLGVSMEFLMAGVDDGR